VVTRRRERGYTLIEVMVAMAVFGIFLAIFFLITAEMRGWDKRLPVSMHKHPDIMAVLARLRRDVLDANSKAPYERKHDIYESSPQVLIIESVQANGEVQMIVWDFREPTIARRISYDVGKKRQWVARGLPQELSNIEVSAVKTGSTTGWATRIVARDSGGRIAIDQIYQPRATD
jgi:prepilin-type N-terminal cleavage/methylation domain-containing protein